MIYLDAEPASIKAARDYVGKVAAESWPVDNYTVRLVASELATNAVRHAKTALIRVNAYSVGSVYVVDVWDGDETVPTVRDPGPSSEGGWGLVAIAEVVTCWGVHRDGTGGKTVFAEWTAP
ncbi:ATP-binding protein [Spirillospora sp. CA-128828]|uniref:ATP-binding protein n=1 Tax=Spirillospora sp. CA-128828 TaxID=3240033 RepID=UPI003D8F3CC1